MNVWDGAADGNADFSVHVCRAFFAGHGEEDFPPLQPPFTRSAVCGR